MEKPKDTFDNEIDIALSKTSDPEMQKVILIRALNGMIQSIEGKKKS